MKQYNKSDAQYGENAENICLPFINKHFKTIFKKTNRFHLFDFENEKMNIEMKSRKCNSWNYYSTIIPLNKLKELDNKETLFLFEFYDGYFYINYSQNKKWFDTLKRRQIVINSGENKGEKRIVIEIPVKALKKIVFCLI